MKIEVLKYQGYINMHLPALWSALLRRKSVCKGHEGLLEARHRERLGETSACTVTAGNHRAVWLWEIPLPVIPTTLGFFHHTCVLFQLANTSFAQSGIHSRVLTWSLLGSKLTKLYLTISKVHNTAAKNRTDKGSPWNSSSMGIKSMSFLTQLRDRHLLEESYLHLSVVLRYFLSPATWHGAISA